MYLLFNLLLLKNAVPEDEKVDPFDDDGLDVVEVALVDDDNGPDDFGVADGDDFLNKFRPCPLLMLLLLLAALPDKYMDERIFGITTSNDEDPKIVATSPDLVSEVPQPLSVGPLSAGPSVASSRPVVNKEDDDEEEDIDASICCLLICM